MPRHDPPIGNPIVNPNVVEGLWKGRAARFRRDRLVVGVRPGVPVEEVLADVGSIASARLQTTVDHLQRPGRSWAVLRFPARTEAVTELPQLAEALSGHRHVLYAEPDFAGNLHLTPSDGNFASQRPWTDVVGMESAWDVTQGSDQVLIAVFDTGISISAGATEPDHDEMRGGRFIVRHTYEGAGVTHDYGADDDKPVDEYGHGTHVTGIIAAASNNGPGIAGINWFSPVYVARVVDQYACVFSSYVKLAMDDLVNYATENKITRVVVNMSFGFWEESEAIKEVRDESAAAGFLVCVGPDSGWDTTLDFPGEYASTSNHIVAVGSVYEGSIQLPQLNEYSKVTVFAPGVDIISVRPNYPTGLWDTRRQLFDPYPLLSGTSQAAAIVSGIASLLWSANLNLTAAQIKDRLVTFGDVLVSGRNQVKVVNANAAVSNAGI